jgi:hypothetical protein
MATAAATPDLSPDEVEDQSIQQAGDEGATYAPAPLQAATNDLGVKYVKPDTSDPNVQRQNTVEGGNAIASVEQGEPRQVEVDDPDKFKANAQQVAPHELYHLWAGNLTPSVAARIPTSTSMDDYKQPTADDLNAMRAKGMTLLDVPSEKGAQMMAWSALHPDDKQYQKALAPYLDDMRKTSPSVILPTSPNDKIINTTPRAPGAPADNIPGMEDFYHHITPGGGRLINRDVAQQYMGKAKGNPAVARIMAAHDGHQTTPMQPKGRR